MRGYSGSLGLLGVIQGSLELLGVIRGHSVYSMLIGVTGFTQGYSGHSGLLSEYCLLRPLFKQAKVSVFSNELHRNVDKNVLQSLTDLTTSPISMTSSLPVVTVWQAEIKLPDYELYVYCIYTVWQGKIIESHPNPKLNKFWREKSHPYKLAD